MAVPSNASHVANAAADPRPGEEKLGRRNETADGDVAHETDLVDSSPSISHGADRRHGRPRSSAKGETDNNKGELCCSHGVLPQETRDWVTYAPSPTNLIATSDRRASRSPGEIVGPRGGACSIAELQHSGRILSASNSPQICIVSVPFASTRPYHGPGEPYSGANSLLRTVEVRSRMMPRGATLIDMII
jgi:hypothetical protein